MLELKQWMLDVGVQNC